MSKVVLPEVRNIGPDQRIPARMIIGLDDALAFIGKLQARVVALPSPEHQDRLRVQRNRGCTLRIIGFGVYCGDMDGPALCRLCKKAISQQNLPNYLSSDNHPFFQYQRWKANLRILGIQEIKSIPCSTIRSVRRRADWQRSPRAIRPGIFFWRGLKRKLASYQAYYNEHRTHTVRAGVPPESSEGNVLIDLAQYKWQSHCRGLSYLPVAA